MDGGFDSGTTDFDGGVVAKRGSQSLRHEVNLIVFNIRLGNGFAGFFVG